ncbi:hypothetical protein [Glycomyces arizonensis]|uniref:hypothetical protein n=1 Tax=Glycomyces arizonensis TaxID=256035 RepID=UPI00042054E6|nr:hypothetical protein [Glycomyces arizonensis]
MGMDDKFNEMKDKARDKASDMGDQAKDKAGDMFNKDQESGEEDEQGGFMDDLKEKGRDAASKMRGDEE